MTETSDFRFSDEFSLGSVEDEEWFDPFLNLDTELFVDPFLIYGNEKGLFEGSHGEIVGFFNHIFERVAQSGGSKTSAHWIRAVDCLSFPEMQELCLGYTSQGTRGAGSGKDIAVQIARAIWTAIELGTVNLSHFEEIQIFGRGIGPDRISDATARILLHRFAAYTQAIAESFGIATREAWYARARYDTQKGLWIGERYKLPQNRYNGKPVLLVPKRYMRPLPTLNPEDYWRYCLDNEATAVAQMFGSDIITKIPKDEIVRLALARPDTRARYVAHREVEGSEPYDFVIDPRGFIKWYEQTKRWAEKNAPPLSFQDAESFAEFVDRSLKTFQNYVENQGGWSLLWNENETPKREDASQRLLLGVISHICAANNVDISREVNIGRGPVDFKMSSGYQNRALIELKLAKNTKFWDGLAAQLPTYLKAEQIGTGWFVVIVYREQDLDRISGIEDKIARLNDQLPYTIKPLIIDARWNPPSASTLKSDLLI